jgi:small neutral amino acid transporter SnatA (MarC family)
MSQEYILAIVLILGGILKVFGIEIENSALEGIIGGAIALWIAVRRFKKGDITLGGVKK